MYCSRCGHENQDDARFCSSCGESLPGAESGRGDRPPREQIAALVGTNRRARLITIGTLIAIAIAIVAFVSLPDEDAPDDDYTLAADELCVQAKREIAAARPAPGGAPSDQSGFAADIVVIVTRWRSDFNDLIVPSDRAGAAAALSAALLDVAVQGGALARIAPASEAQVAEQGKRVDQATAAVEGAIDDLGLDRCAAIEITPAGLAEA